MQFVPITTNFVSSNPAEARCTQYSIMWKMFVSEMQQVGGFLRFQ